MLRGRLSSRCGHRATRSRRRTTSGARNAAGLGSCRRAGRKARRQAQAQDGGPDRAQDPAARCRFLAGCGRPGSGHAAGIRPWRCDVRGGGHVWLARRRLALPRRYLRPPRRRPGLVRVGARPGAVWSLGARGQAGRRRAGALPRRGLGSLGDLGWLGRLPGFGSGRRGVHAGPRRRWLRQYLAQLLPPGQREAVADAIKDAFPGGGSHPVKLAADPPRPILGIVGQVADQDLGEDLHGSHRVIDQPPQQGVSDHAKTGEPGYRRTRGPSEADGRRTRLVPGAGLGGSLGGGLRCPLRLLPRVSERSGAKHVRHVRGRLALLHRVKELMGQDPAAVPGARLVLARGEEHVVPDREGDRVDGPRRLPGRLVGVHPDLPEVVPEEGLHVCLDVALKRTAHRGGRVVDEHGRDLGPGRRDGRGGGRTAAPGAGRRRPLRRSRRAAGLDPLPVHRWLPPPTRPFMTLPRFPARPAQLPGARAGGRPARSARRGGAAEARCLAGRGRPAVRTWRR